MIQLTSTGTFAAQHELSSYQTSQTASAHSNIATIKLFLTLLLNLDFAN